MASDTHYEKYKSDGSIQGNALEWFDARFPATSMWRGHLSEYYAPKNFNFWYFFGSLAMLVLVIQIVTGIFLVMHYKPDASLNANGVPVAFASVEYIMRDVSWGWLIRYMHSTGASAFFIVVYLHMFRGMLYGSYRQPRELIWVFGVMIFLALMAEGFAGYLLPWGQMSYWGAQVILNLFSAIPLIGNDLAIWIRGDFVIGDATLNRMFSFHVIAIPLALLGLVAAHILALHEVGSNNPDGVEIKSKKDEHGIPLDGIPFHPYYSVKDIVGVVVFLMVFSIIVFFAPEGGGYLLEYNNFIPADPMVTPSHIAPVWYFTPYYSLLRAVTYPLFGIDAKFWGVVAMGAGVLIFAFLPWLDRSPVKSIRYRGSIYKTLLTLFVIAFFILGFLGTKSPSYAFFGVIPGAPIAQLLTAYYFLYFLTMPWWSKIDKYKPEPERVTFK
ncbi:MAG: cytochrome b N-terminal domain-containing protein [Betaproteobacteria bacterium]|nr:cytochrome b N-terminal domain-containing protein [Betaproteobacteria bacterium]